MYKAARLICLGLHDQSCGLYDPSLGSDLDLRVHAFRALCYMWYKINEMKGCVLETHEVVLCGVWHRISEMKGLSVTH